MKSRFLLRSRNEKWFQAAIDLRKEIDLVCLSFAMTLEINESLGVAFLKPLSSEAEDTIAFQVGRRRTLGPLASALVYKLRHQRLQFYLSPTNDSAPLVTLEELREFLQNFNSAKVDSLFERSFRRSLEELSELQIIIETKQESGVYEITPLCEILLPLDGIKDLKLRMEKYFNREPESGVEDVG